MAGTELTLPEQRWDTRPGGRSCFLVSKLMSIHLITDLFFFHSCFSHLYFPYQRATLDYFQCLLAKHLRTQPQTLFPPPPTHNSSGSSLLLVYSSVKSERPGLYQQEICWWQTPARSQEMGKPQSLSSRSVSMKWNLWGSLLPVGGFGFGNDKNREYCFSCYFLLLGLGQSESAEVLNYLTNRYNRFAARKQICLGFLSHTRFLFYH